MRTAAPLQAATAKPQSSRRQGIVLQRKCACGASKSPLGEMCDECQSRALQRKFAIGASNDPLELEADRVAEQVTSMRMPYAVHAGPVRVQRLGSPSGGQSGSAPTSVEQVLASSGRPLEPGLRSDMEVRFGRDFSSVRIHRGEDAEKSARDVNASAYTVGRDIVFGAGSYAPRSEAGRRLLAHELAHTLQQEGQGRRIQRALAGGCAEPGDTWPEAMEESSLAGVHAHNQIQEKFFPQLDIEAELPRGTKKRQGKGCPEKTRDPGKIDLWQSSGGRTVQIGEIKSVNSEATGLEEVQHYLLRYRQMIERLTGGGCYEAVADEKDVQFVSKWLHRNLKKDELPKAVALTSVVPTTKTRVGVYRGNPTKDLFCKRVQGGAVVYWCNKRPRRTQDEEEEKRLEKRDTPSVRADEAKGKDLNIPLFVTVAALLGLSTAAVTWPRAKAPTVPTTTPRTPTVSAPPPTPKPQAPSPKPTPSSTATRRPHRPPPRPSAGTGTRVHRPAAGTRVSPPRATPRVGARPGGIRAPSGGGALRVGGGLLTLLSLYGAYKTIQGAKADIDALRGPYEAYWDEFLKQQAAQKSTAAAVPQPTPAPAPPRPEPEPPRKPPEKETKVRLFEITRSRLSEREASVPSASIGTAYLPVEFLSLTRPGERTTAVNASQIDCSRIHKGIAGLSGYQKYTGYARAGDIEALNKLLGYQITFARLACVASGRGSQPAAQPDGDEISVTLSVSGESVTATCKKPAGASGSACTSEGNFASMKALMDDPELEYPPDFLLEVTVVRTRNGESQRSDRTISVWIANPDHPAPEPSVQAEGSVPADASNWKAYPSGSEIAYLLEIYSRWGQ
jgi:hypothetical protein